MVCGTTCGTRNHIFVGQTEIGMKRYPRYGIRVSEGLDGALRRAGPERVREVLEGAFLGKLEAGVPSWSKGKIVEEAGLVPDDAEDEIRERVAERLASDSTVLPRVKVFEQSAEERAAKLERLRGLPGVAKAPAEAPVAMKMYAQMPPRVDYYALGDPEAPEE